MRIWISLLLVLGTLAAAAQDGGTERRWQVSAHLGRPGVLGHPPICGLRCTRTFSYSTGLIVF